MSFKIWSNIALASAIVLMSIFVIRIYLNSTDDFQIAHITFDKKNFGQVGQASSKIEEEFPPELQQSFFYLGKGGQSYAFLSQDKNYVLKLFKFKHLKQPWWMKLLPSISFFKELKKRADLSYKRRFKGVVQGYDLAYQEYREKSHLIYTHLRQTTDLKTLLNLTDKVGRCYQIAADDFLFILQRKGETLNHQLSNLFLKKDVKNVKRKLEKIFQMYVAEYELGIYDRDHNILENVGFIGEIPFRLDVGKLTKNSQVKDVEIYHKDLKVVFWKIHQWIKKNHLVYLEEIEKFLILQYFNYTQRELDLSQVNLDVIKTHSHSFP